MERTGGQAGADGKNNETSHAISCSLERCWSAVAIEVPCGLKPLLGSHNVTGHMPRRNTMRSVGDEEREPGALHATESGTQAYSQRFQGSFAADYFRKTTFGLAVSSIGIGTYLGDPTDAVDAAYEHALSHAVRNGINVIDTAINYRAQRSERAVGVALRRLFANGEFARDEIVVSTKGGYVPLDQNPPTSREAYLEYVQREFIDTEIVTPKELVGGGHSLAPRFIKYCLAKSRQNLGLRTIDTYYVHNPGQQLGAVSQDRLFERLRETFGALEDAADRGEIGVYGVATWDSLLLPPDSPQHLELADIVGLAAELAGDQHRFRAIQLPINLGMREAASSATQTIDGRLVTTLEAAEHLGITVVASATLMQSKLAAGLPDEVSTVLPGFTSDAQRAVAFTRRLPNVDVALVGMKQSEHVDDTLKAGRS